ncbi:hypothetical protein SLA2020_211150 [Shorea laevis]
MEPISLYFPWSNQNSHYQIKYEQPPCGVLLQQNDKTVNADFQHQVVHKPQQPDGLLPSSLSLPNHQHPVGMASMKKFIALFLVAAVLQWGGSHAQQPYVNQQQLACNNNNNITKGYSCNSFQKPCLSYVTFRSTPPYDSADTIAHLLGADANLISSLNRFPSKTTTIPSNELVFVPVNCSCFGNYYQHNSSYVINEGDTYFTVSNNTYQGLNSCRAMEAQNPFDQRKLMVGAPLPIPLRCACPTYYQNASGINYLLTDIVTWGGYRFCSC